MIERTSVVKRFLAAVVEPISAEKRAALAARWAELPDSLRIDTQVVGRQLVHCGYTLGPAYCSFGCTHCYLPRNANKAPLPTLEDMKRQIDANRRIQGPDSGLQITGGDVVDAYWKRGRADELVAIIRYATDRGMVPMLMTHGQVLLENPDYLERLVVEGGLRKLAVHIDITQAGRPGYPIKTLTRESDLHPLRQAFADLIVDVQERTRIGFSAAHTVTVTERNIDSLGDVFEWLSADPRRLRAFRMISLQPEAAVGRTRYSERPVTPEKTWSKVCEALGSDLDRDNLSFGHPDCSNMTTVLLRPREGKRPEVVNLIPSDPASKRYWTRFLEVFGGVGSRGADHARANGQRLGRLLRHPGFFFHTLAWAFGRLRAAGAGVGFVRDVLRGRVGGLNIVLHNFMGDDELQAGGEVVEQRLAACSFRGAVERDGEWVAVPMCAMNVEEREGIYERQIGEAEREDKPLLAVVA
jgi:hypothetical protein